MERIDRSKFDRPFGLGYLFPRLDDCGTFLFAAFLTDTHPHGTGIIEVFEDTEVPADARPGQLDSAIKSGSVNFSIGK